MPCCPSNIIPFFDTPVSVIAYTPAMKSIYGPEPKLSVYYKRTAGDWYTISNLMGTDVRYDDTLSEIIIDHGGVFSGFVKIN